MLKLREITATEPRKKSNGTPRAKPSPEDGRAGGFLVCGCQEPRAASGRGCELLDCGCLALDVASGSRSELRGCGCGRGESGDASDESMKSTTLNPNPPLQRRGDLQRRRPANRQGGDGDQLVWSRRGQERKGTKAFGIDIRSRIIKRISCHDPACLPGGVLFAVA